jgi:hypothetical protein
VILEKKWYNATKCQDREIPIVNCCLDMPADLLGFLAKEGLSATVNLITKKEEPLGNVLPKQETLWLGAVVLQKGAATQGMTLSLCTVLSKGEGKQSYTDTSRDRNRSGSCERSDDNYNTIMLTKIHYKEKQHIHSCEVASLILLTNIYIYIIYIYIIYIIYIFYIYIYIYIRTKMRTDS